MTPAVKGRLLEDAAAAIEGAIGKSLPMDARSFRMEMRKIVSVQGVSHEIDIYVEVDPGHGYQSVFIFECKNWSKPVGKNEVIILSEKVRAVSAQRGFLVAQQLTEDARHQLSQDSRLEFLPAALLPIETLQYLVDFEVVCIDQRVADVEFVRRSPGHKREEVAPNNAVVTLRGQPLDVMDFANRWIVESVGQQTPSIMTDGTAREWHRLEDVRGFDAGELVVNGVDACEIRLRVEYRLVPVRPRILSAFDIHRRGRAAVLEPIAVPGGGSIRITLAELAAGMLAN